MYIFDYKDTDWICFHVLAQMFSRNTYRNKSLKRSGKQETRSSRKKLPKLYFHLKTYITT